MDGIQKQSDEDDITVVTSNSSTSQEDQFQTEDMCGNIGNQPSINIPKNWAILDSGATAIFVMQDAPIKNIQVATNPITVNMPQGAKERSTHTCELDLPQLPKKARTGHIILKKVAYNK